MQLKMSKNSLFAYLLRSPWWISFGIAFLIASVARYFFAEKHGIYVISVAFPFLLIGMIAAWRQFRTPSAARIDKTLAAISAISWRDFSAQLQLAFEKDGYAVTRTTGVADFRLVKAGRTALVLGKRWKAANHGLEPLRELEAARDAQEVNDAIYVAAGNMTENAQRFARGHGITLLQGAELTRLLRL